ncbi:DUF2752 domain-containing protein [Leptospira semungkisensis]|nr:DUF2752 domain-containing protein [Leptospira semungkisensis]
MPDSVFSRSILFILTKNAIFLTFLLVTCVLIAKNFPLDTESEYWFTVCWWKHLTGWDCPGCGLSRAVICFFRGDLSRSWEYHPYGIPVSFLGIFLFGLRWNISKSEWKKFLNGKNFGIFSWVFLLGLFVWYFQKQFLN